MNFFRCLKALIGLVKIMRKIYVPTVKQDLRPQCVFTCYGIESEIIFFYPDSPSLKIVGSTKKIARCHNRFLKARRLKK
ncbi:hypothetical protein S922_14090 [Salmonella enterica subsp. enterica]|nr:hypothetical protein [Salmonella enterica subsp. enterica]